MSPLKVEFDTVRDLEKKTFKVFAYTACVLAAGVISTGVGLVLIGIALLVVGMVGLVGGAAWVSALGKEPTKQVFCPYCASRNDVYASRRAFRCDICARPVALGDDGRVIAVLHPEEELPGAD